MIFPEQIDWWIC